MSHKLTLKNCIQFGFSNAAYISPDEIEFLEDVRRMCEDNRCGQYGRNWMCPPACGTLGELREMIRGYDYGVLLQVTERMEDDFDVEAMERAEKNCKRFLHELNDALNKESVFCEVLVLGAGTCDICTICSYPDAPCVLSPVLSKLSKFQKMYFFIRLREGFRLVCAGLALSMLSPRC